jgi:L-iditol 2-dehydrogenase
VRALRVIAHGPNQVQLVNVADAPALAEGEVLVATRSVGVCGSDLHAWHGTQTYPMTYPVTLGHEAMGVVAALGPGVTSFAIGDRVVSETARSVCGVCRACRTGNYNLCAQRLGFGARFDGAMADYFVTRAQILHAVPANVSDGVAATTEPYCVAYNAAVERARISPGDVVSVVGPGPVGVFAAQVARAAGASDVLVVGIPGDEPRLRLAQELGATEVLVATEPQWWAGTPHADASDVVIDASGVSATLETALGLVRAAGTVVKVGWGPEPYGQPLDALVAKAVDLHGSFSHTWTTWERVLKLLSTRQLDPQAAISTYAFDDWERAFTAMGKRETLKSVLAL